MPRLSHPESRSRATISTECPECTTTMLQLLLEVGLLECITLVALCLSNSPASLKLAVLVDLVKILVPPRRFRNRDFMARNLPLDLPLLGLRMLTRPLPTMESHLACPVLFLTLIRRCTTGNLNSTWDSTRVELATTMDMDSLAV